MPREPWTREEAVIALGTYLSNRTSLPNDKSHSVIASLSDQLRALGAARGVIVDDKFRNPAGCFMKLRTFQYLDTAGASGLSGASKLDERIFTRYSADPIGLALAIAAATAGDSIPNDDPPQDLPADFNPSYLSTASTTVLLSAPQAAWVLWGRGNHSDLVPAQLEVSLGQLGPRPLRRTL